MKFQEMQEAMAKPSELATAASKDAEAEWSVKADVAMLQGWVLLLRGACQRFNVIAKKVVAETDEVFWKAEDARAAEVEEVIRSEQRDSDTVSTTPP